MKSENTFETKTINKVGALVILRTIDFAALAANAVDGKIDAAAIMNGGDFSVRFTASGRENTPIEFPCASHDAARSFVAGFEAMADMKKTRAPKTSSFVPEEFVKTAKKADVEALKKPEGSMLAKHLGVTFKSSMKKGEINALSVAKLKLK